MVAMIDRRRYLSNLVRDVPKSWELDQTTWRMDA